MYNLRANPDVEICDGTKMAKMRVQEVTEDPERGRLWSASVAAYPPYDDYQAKTTRKIPCIPCRARLSDCASEIAAPMSADEAEAER